MDSIRISPCEKDGKRRDERERRGGENERKKKERKGEKEERGKWKAGIKTKGGEDGVCDGGNAPFFRDAATYRRARAALKGFTCARTSLSYGKPRNGIQGIRQIFFHAAPMLPPREDARRSFGDSTFVTYKARWYSNPLKGAHEYGGARSWDE